MSTTDSPRRAGSLPGITPITLELSTARSFIRTRARTRYGSGKRGRTSPRRAAARISPKSWPLPAEPELGAVRVHEEAEPAAQRLVERGIREDEVFFEAAHADPLPRDRPRVGVRDRDHADRALLAQTGPALREVLRVGGDGGRGAARGAAKTDRDLAAKIEAVEISKSRLRKLEAVSDEDGAGVDRLGGLGRRREDGVVSQPQRVDARALRERDETLGLEELPREERHGLEIAVGSRRLRSHALEFVRDVLGRREVTRAPRLPALAGVVREPAHVRPPGGFGRREQEKSGIAARRAARAAPAARRGRRRRIGAGDGRGWSAGRGSTAATERRPGAARACTGG